MGSGARLATVGLLLTLASATAIRCWKCGQYSDGVGSITPCNNRSATKLEECPSNAKFCIFETMGTGARLVTVGLLLTLASATAIRCWKCGQYSNGVGSITPCNNRSATKLEECPSNSKFCIKYVSELTIVRDCVPTCKEKEWWGARTFCCETDECNSSAKRSPLLALSLVPFVGMLAR